VFEAWEPDGTGAPPRPTLVERLLPGWRSVTGMGTIAVAGSGRARFQIGVERKQADAGVTGRIRYHSPATR
jgi:hypothetical protein